MNFKGIPWGLLFSLIQTKCNPSLAQCFNIGRERERERDNLIVWRDYSSVFMCKYHWKLSLKPQRGRYGSLRICMFGNNTSSKPQSSRFSAGTTLAECQQQCTERRAAIFNSSVLLKPFFSVEKSPSPVRPETFVCWFQYTLCVHRFSSSHSLKHTCLGK